MPQNNQCPIALEAMRIPTITNEGHSYELSALADHILQNNNTDPFTREPITLLIVNQSLRDVNITLTDKELVNVLRLCVKIRQKYPKITIHGVDRMTSTPRLAKNSQNVYAYFKNTPPKENNTYQKAVTKLLFIGLLSIVSSAIYAMIGSECLKKIGVTTNSNTSKIASHAAAAAAFFNLILCCYFISTDRNNAEQSLTANNYDKLIKIITTKLFTPNLVLQGSHLSLISVLLFEDNKWDVMLNTFMAIGTGMFIARICFHLLLGTLESLDVIESKIKPFQQGTNKKTANDLLNELENCTINRESSPQMKR
jgi:hypothetical protein